MDLSDIPAYVLCGGRSTRFGSDKARAPIAGVPMLVHVVSGLSARGMAVTAVAATAGAYDDLGVRTIGDAIHARGPIGGVITALRDASRTPGEWALVAACDQVGVDFAWVDLLVSSVREGIQAVHFHSDRDETLFALYHLTCEAHLCECVRAGRLALHDALRGLDRLSVAAPPGWENVVNVNTPESMP